MASANLELVRSIYAAWVRGDYRSVDWADPEIEFAIEGGAASGSWTGLAGMAEGWRGFLDAWAQYRTEVEEYRELDGERVIVLAHFSARGKASGLEVGRELGQVGMKGLNLFHLRNGKVTKLVLYFDHEHGLAELGLAPDGG